MDASPLDRLKGVALLVANGALGAGIAIALGAPLPFLLGAMVATATLCLTYGPRTALPLVFPQNIRNAFVAIIGVMIGSAFTPELLSQSAVLIPGSIAVAVFVGLSHGANYLIFSRLGHYDKISAHAAAMPGGLMESIQITEEKGGDTALVTAQQFLRVALIVTFVPLAFSFWQGEAVGSAAGMRLATDTGGPIDWLLLALAAIVGYLGGKRLRIPAYSVVGPMAVSAIFHATGLTHAAVPPWLVATSQLVIGVGLGTRFINLRGKDYRRIILLGLLSSAVMVSIGLAISAVLHPITDTPVPVLILSFAPGGLIEMGLIALSLEASPLIVTFYHIIRIILTVLLATLVLSRLTPTKRP